MRQRLIKKMVLVLAMVVMLVAAGCDLTLDQEGTGSLAVSLGSSTRNLVWEPALDMDVASYTIRGAGPTADDSFEVSGHTGGLFTRDGLSVGQWTITVDGYDTNGTKIATVQAAATVTRNATTPVTMVLRPLEGTGTLSVSMSWTDSQGVLASLSAVVVIRDEEGSDIDSLSTPVSLTITGQSATGEVTNLPTGWYEVTVSLKDGNTNAWQGVFALRIVDGQTTTGNVVIPESQILVGPSMGTVAITIQEDMDDPLSVGFSGMPDSVEAGDTVTLTSTGLYSGNEQYRWYINGVRQTDQTASSFSHTFDMAGTYTVSLLVLEWGALGGYGESIAVVEEPVTGYAVGEIGPAGGYVFYDDEIGYDLDGDGTIEEDEKHLLGDGKRYLEAAPSDIMLGASDYNHIFGYYRTTVNGLVTLVGTATGIGTGEANTAALIVAMGEAAYTRDSTATTTTTGEYAARLCDIHEVGGCNDWFLPSKDELDLMYQNLYRNNLGGFPVDNYYYWSSSECSEVLAWLRCFFSGGRGMFGRNYGERVRPIRAF